MRPVRVSLYEGSKHAEFPLAVELHGRMVEVKVRSQWIEEDLAARSRRRCFVVEPVRGGKPFRLVYEETEDRWYINN